MDEVTIFPRNNVIVDLGTFAMVNLDELSHNRERFTIEQYIAALQITTTLTDLNVNFLNFNSTPGNDRHIIERLCRCIANLRQHNQNHTLRTLQIYGAKEHHDVKPFLVAAKQFGIHHLSYVGSAISVQSLEKFLHDNTKLNGMHIQESSIYLAPQDGPPDSSAVLVMDTLTINIGVFENSTVATRFLNTFAHVTYPTLQLGRIVVGGRVDDDQEKKIVSGLIKPSVQQLTLERSCPIEVMEVIEACPTVTQIQLDNNDPPFDFRPAAVHRKLQAIASRNRNLERFVANPRDRDYSGDVLLELMLRFDRSPTGRYMLARCFPGIPSFFKINASNDSSTARVEKRKRSR